MGNVVEAGGDLPSAPGEFAAGQRFQHQGGNQAVTEERDFFGFVVHGVVLFSSTAAYGGRRRGSMQMVCGETQTGAATEADRGRRPPANTPRRPPRPAPPPPPNSTLSAPAHPVPPPPCRA